jgi:hypothetical protein
LRGKPSHGCCFAEASFRISWAPRAAWCATAGGACCDAALWARIWMTMPCFFIF